MHSKSVVCSARTGMATGVQTGQGPSQQEERDRQSVRNELRKRKRDAQMHADNAGSELLEKLEETEDLGTRVTCPRERALESELLNAYADQALKLVSGLAETSSDQLTTDDLMRSMRQRFVAGSNKQRKAMESRRAFDWAELGKFVGQTLPFFAARETLLGSLQVQPRPKATQRGKSQQQQQQQRRKGKEAFAVETAPEELESAAETGKTTETGKNSERVYEAIKSHEQAHSEAPLFAEAIDGDTFSQVVEQAFALSFLCKGGFCTLEMGDSGLRARTRTPYSKEDHRAKRSSFVLSFGPRDWQAFHGASPNANKGNRSS